MIWYILLLLSPAIGYWWGKYTVKKQEKKQEQIDDDWKEFLRLDKINKLKDFIYYGIRYGIDTWIPKTSFIEIEYANGSKYRIRIESSNNSTTLTIN